MLSRFQASFQRVDASLQRLSDSIAAYNPSETASDELLAADNAVSEDVNELITHQENHERLKQLRQRADALDEQIKNTLRLLADTRKEIQDIPSIDDGDERREVKVDELLSYAKFIAKTTVPPTYRKPLPTLNTAKDESGDAHITNGIATPPPQDNGEVRAVKELGEGRKQWIDTNSVEFVPYPHGEMLRRGVLGKIQKMLEEGKDPADVLSPEEQAEVDRRKREQEARDAQEEEERQRKAREAFGFVRRQTVDTSFNPDDL